MNNTRTAQTVLVATLLLPSVPGPGQQVVERRVAIIVPEADDERVVHTRDAVAFWNQTLSDLESGVRLREVALIIPDGRAVENFAREVSLRGGRLPRGAAGPEPPGELTGLEADIVVLLSRQPLLPFAWPLAGSPSYLVAVRAAEPRRPSDSTILRNVIAHELGHTLGLKHNRDQATLMCGPCSSVIVRDGPQGWLPLTANDRAQLRTLRAR